MYVIENVGSLSLLTFMRIPARHCHIGTVIVFRCKVGKSGGEVSNGATSRVVGGDLVSILVNGEQQIKQSSSVSLGDTAPPSNEGTPHPLPAVGIVAIFGVLAAIAPPAQRSPPPSARA